MSCWHQAHQSPVLARSDSAGFASNEERFVRTQALFNRPVAHLASKQRMGVSPSHSSGAQLFGKYAAAEIMTDAQHDRLSQVRTPGTATCDDGTHVLPVLMPQQIARKEAKRRKFLEHNQRLHQYAEATDAKVAHVHAARVHSKIRQQLTYLEALGQRR